MRTSEAQWVPRMLGRTPWSARVPLDPLPQALTNTSSRPTWASAADQGVRPTWWRALHQFFIELLLAPRDYIPIERALYC